MFAVPDLPGSPIHRTVARNGEKRRRGIAGVCDPIPDPADQIAGCGQSLKVNLAVDSPPWPRSLQILIMVSALIYKVHLSLRSLSHMTSVHSRASNMPAMSIPVCAQFPDKPIDTICITFGSHTSKASMASGGRL